MSAGQVAFVGIGSNLDGPVDRVIAAVEALSRIPDTRVTGKSRLYGSAPMGPSDQPDYVNAVARILTGLDPHALLDALQEIETGAGRTREGEHWGPRTLDLDLLLHGDATCSDERLTLPHPGITERAFVLVPLAELEPDLVLPGSDKTVRQFAAQVEAGDLWPLEAAS